MDFDLIIIILGTLVLGAGVYFKFIKSDSSSQEQEQPKEEKKKREITYGQIKLFYGSQSGTATKLAGILEEEAQQHFFDPEVYGVEKFEEQIIQNKPTLAIFLMATHGEGDPTDNAIQFMKWLKSQDRTNQDLNNMQFIVFGLGNTQYEHYNLMGRNTNKFLEKLGAKPLYKYGEGDDNSTLEDDFNDWKEELWNQLKQIIEPKPYDENQQQQNQENKQQQQQQQQNMEPVNIDTAKIQEGLKYDFQTQHFLQSSIAFVKDIREIRESTEGGSTLHMEIDLTKANLEYKTAQNLGIYVENDQKLVVKLAEYLKVDLNKVIQNPAGTKNVMFPAPLAIRDVLTYFCDFQGQLMKKTLKDLAKICENEENKKKLELMASAKGKQLFKEEIENNKETIFNLMQKYQIVPTFDQFLLMTPRLSPRVFTISSSNLLHKNVVHVTDSLLVDDLPSGGKKIGVCSQYFEKINNNFKNGMMNQKIRVDFRESSFKLPQDQTPVIMVGAGTGVAPFIAFAQEKSYLVQKGINIAPGEFTLYFGCRNENKDFIFKNEIKQWVDQKIINKLYTAFSRDTDKKIYVQDRVMGNQDEVYETLFEKKGTLFICGSMGMGKSVVQSVQKIIMSKQNLSEQESGELIKKMEEERKLIKELW